MALFDCENKDIENALKTLAAQVIAAGGFIHEYFGIRERGGDLSGFALPGVRAGERLLILPQSALIPFGGVEIGIEDNRFYLKSAALDITPAQRGICKTMLDIYNYAGKAEKHREGSIWTALADKPAILDRIIAGRAEAPLVKTLRRKVGPSLKNLEPLAVESFFRSRTLAFRSGADNPETGRVIMPFADFINHHPRAPSYRPFAKDPEFKGKGDGVIIVKSRPAPLSDETFVQYGFLDSYDFLVLYSSAETKAPYARSIPMTVKIDDVGEIAVGSRLGVLNKKKLPEGFSDLQAFMPVIISRKPGCLKLSHLMIPPRRTAPHALRRVLNLLVSGMEITEDNARLNAWTQEAEARIIAENVKFYRDLDAFMESGEGAAAPNIIRKTVRICTAHQLSILNAHEKE